MAEIIGVAASATQLGAACFSLIDLLRKIKGGASTLKRYHEQLQELQSLSTCISQNPLLQTPEIGSQTKALLSIINNNCIESLLRKGRFLRTWGLLYREHDLIDTFVRLEQQKSSLSLAIEQIQSKTLYQIQTDIQNMSKEKTVRNLTTVSDSEDTPKSVVRGGTPDTTLLSTYTAPLDHHLAASIHSMLVASYQRCYSNMPSSVNSNDPASAKSDQDGAQWNNCSAGPRFDQRNGHTYKMDAPFSVEIAKNKRSVSIFNNSVKIGEGNQYNGNHVKFSGDRTGARIPDRSENRWNNAQVYAGPADTAENKILGTQYNGDLIEYEETATTDTKQSG
ncbi:hypothetical protein FLONG3_5802 [Fusarium longipes]|uniref:Fungal N-terminal domain-containing protein n=1 Tax=Fusarium longipes TaxID=694270 RepID=A0A395SRL6_9HYPO|nr:hypothetical protein FLONG3_5802 [Fusarium longipes]